jgi:hypothetical protein
MISIDGDGRADYCLVHNTDGTIRCWRNGGVGQYVDYWQSFNEAGGGGVSDSSNVSSFTETNPFKPQDIVFRSANGARWDRDGVRLGT